MLSAFFCSLFQTLSQSRPQSSGFNGLAYKLDKMMLFNWKRTSSKLPNMCIVHERRFSGNFEIIVMLDALLFTCSAMCQVVI